MTTNFFEQQAQARRKTSQLVFLYCCAVLAIIFAVYVVIYFAWAYAAQRPQLLESVRENSPFLPNLFEPMLFLKTALVTGGIIVLGTLYKIAVLGKGGKVVAESLGGRLIDPSTRDFHERKAVNVVEEMAIASGLPVPPIYVLDSEDGINAFAAGYSPSDAVIGLTRGCITRLKRNELQGVVGHEFSHILNGDMRLNLRLMGVLFGILLLGLIGETLIRSSGNTHSRGRKKDGIGAAILLTGFGLFVVGYVGVFFGRLIKSAVSRQREYLADMASVQFTRNPQGLSGALKKIAGLSSGSSVESIHASEAAHLFFADALARSFLNLFATHPPLLERIKRIDPSFSGSAAAIEAFVEADAERGEEGYPAADLTSHASSCYRAQQQSPAEVVASIGKLSPERVKSASALIQSLDPVLRSAAVNQLGARALALALVMTSNAGKPRPGREDLAAHLGFDLANAVEKLIPYANEIEPLGRLSLLDLCMPALRMLSQSDYLEFRKQLHWMIEEDRVINFFEYAVTKLVCRHLDALFIRKPQRPIRLSDMTEALPAAREVISHLALVSGGTAESKERGFQNAMKCLTNETPGSLPDSKSLSFKRFDAALKTLEFASFAIRGKVMEAAAYCIADDAVINAAEMALIRSLGSQLDCPVPLPGCNGEA